MFGTLAEQEVIFEVSASYVTKQAPLTPRPVQLLTLDKLQQTRDENYTKVLVVLAIGLAKMYLLEVFFRREFQACSIHYTRPYFGNRDFQK